MNANRQGRTGFTILEILVVLVVIIVLAGMVFKMMGLAGKKNEEANTRARIEKLANAIEEFRATYGRYPPVPFYPGENGPYQPVEYEYAIERWMPSGLANQIIREPENLWSANGNGRFFTFGLLSFIFPRYNNHASASPPEFIGGNIGDPYRPDLTINQWRDQVSRGTDSTVGDNPYDIDASRKMLPYIGVTLNKDGEIENGEYGLVGKWRKGRKVPGNSGVVYTNAFIFFNDSWDRGIHYESRPPHDSFRLWSNGADGSSGTDDDIVVGKE